MKKTAELVVGDDVRLVDYGNTTKAYRRMLLSLGITYGTRVRVSRVAPLGCPIQLEVLGVSLAIRKQEAQDLLWE